MGDSVNDMDMNEWVIVKSTGGSGYIGRLSGGFYDPELKADVLMSLRKGTLCLSPCFSYAILDRPVQDAQGRVGLQREPMLMPFDLFSHEVPVHVSGTALVFFSDAQESDRNKYKSLVQQALDTMTRMRAQEVGIELSPSISRIRA